MRRGTRLRMAAAAAALALAASLGIAISPASAVAPVAAVSGDQLSDSGQAAIADLRTCLASQSTLNVYYLVDSSLSLAKADGGAAGSGSDPEFIRASILGNSLAQLGTLGADVQVNWAAGFFSSGYSEAIGWQGWTDAGPAALEKAIKERTPSGYTNWPAALTGAQNQLAQQQSSAPGCQMLVWLTDGQLDIAAPDGQQQEDFDALNAMCGAELDDRGAAATGTGVFNSFRQSGVVVIGALLAVDADSQAASDDMQALVEGGTVCGEQPMPDSFVHGAFVEASGPDSLALLFLQLSAQVSGGYPQPFDADGGFWVDEGVARFRIIVSGDWSLTPPDGSGRSVASPSSPQDWAAATEADGATVIDVAVDDDAVGHWMLQADAARSLFLFSDLRIVFDDVSAIQRAADGSLEATLNATVRDANGDAVDLDEYGTAQFQASYLDASGSRVALPEPVLGDGDGTVSIELPSDVALASIEVTASLDPLITAEHALELAPVTTEKSIALTLPGEYPHVEVDPPTTLSTLEGADGEATGAITVLGPTQGGDGTACFASDDVTITSDAGDRGDSWSWRFDGLDADGCIAVPAGGQIEVPVSVRNPVAADSSVQASVRVTFAAADAAGIAQDVPLQFRSTHPINTAAVLLLAIVLLVIGILLPLLALWILNWLTTRIDVPKSTQRAAFPLTVSSTAVDITAPAQGSALSDAFAYSRPTDGERAISDPVLGTLRARVPWFPLRTPWYEVVAPAGAALITARAGRGVTGQRQGAGSLRFARLPLDRFWAVVVPEGELRRTSRGEPVSGTVVLYHRASPSEQGQHAQRLAEITLDSTLAEAVNRARADLIERDRRSGGGAQAVRTPAAPADPTSTAEAPPRGAPPLPGRASAPGATPPVRPGSGSPSRQAPGTTPPPTGGPSRTPPPRPGTPPPPRP